MLRRIQFNVSQIKATSHYAGKYCSSDYPNKYFHIRIASLAKLHTKLKHCITYRVHVCNLSDDVPKLKKSYGNHMKATVEENIILMCPKIKATSHYARKCCTFDYPNKQFHIRIVS